MDFERKLAAAEAEHAVSLMRIDERLLHLEYPQKLWGEGQEQADTRV